MNEAERYLQEKLQQRRVTQTEHVPLNTKPAITQHIVGVRVALKRYWKGCFTFKGRASRSEFWWAYWGTCLILPVCILSFFILFQPRVAHSPWFDVWNIFLALLVIGILFLKVFASLAITIRRLHDLNLSGWWCGISVPDGSYLLSCYWLQKPTLLLIWLIIHVGFLLFLCRPSDPRPNRYGPVPNMRP